MYINDNVITQYRYSLRQFVSMLRIGIDQLICLITEGRCESIGNFLSYREKHSDQYIEYDLKFLTGLNVAANYLKHHPYQFESPEQLLTMVSPSLLVMVDKDNDKSKKDYEGLQKYFSQRLIHQPHNSQVACCFDCDFFVAGFNTFYTRLKDLNAALVV